MNNVCHYGSLPLTPLKECEQSQKDTRIQLTKLKKNLAKRFENKIQNIFYKLISSGYSLSKEMSRSSNLRNKKMFE
jgi:uncharacterized protein (DUF302 family)